MVETKVSEVLRWFLFVIVTFSFCGRLGPYLFFFCNPHFGSGTSHGVAPRRKRKVPSFKKGSSRFKKLTLEITFLLIS